MMKNETMDADSVVRALISAVKSEHMGKGFTNTDATNYAFGYLTGALVQVLNELPARKRDDILSNYARRVIDKVGK